MLSFLRIWQNYSLPFWGARFPGSLLLWRVLRTRNGIIAQWEIAHLRLSHRGAVGCHLFLSFSHRLYSTYPLWIICEIGGKMPHGMPLWVRKRAAPILNMRAKAKPQKCLTSSLLLLAQQGKCYFSCTSLNSLWKYDTLNVQFLPLCTKNGVLVTKWLWLKVCLIQSNFIATKFISKLKFFCNSFIKETQWHTCCSALCGSRCSRKKHSPKVNTILWVRILFESGHRCVKEMPQIGCANTHTKWGI